MPQNLIIYHSGCLDGSCAAWITKNNLSNNDPIELVPMNYDLKGLQELNFDDKDVYIVDFSFKRPILKKIIDQANKLVLLDHHQTAQTELAPLIQESNKVTIRFDQSKSGATMAWQYFNPGIPIPIIVRYVEDRDLWKFQLPNSRIISNAIASYVLSEELTNLNIWTSLMEMTPESLAVEGLAIDRYKSFLLQQILKNIQLINLITPKTKTRYENVPMVCSPILQSELGEQLANQYDIGFAIIYYDKPDFRICSLRSKKDGPDVSTITNEYGGGGHRNAAGFEIPLNLDSL